MISYIQFWKQRRYTVCCFCFLGLAMSYLLRVSLVVAIITMTRDVPSKNDPNIFVREFNWTDEQRTTLVGSFFYGYTITQLPGGYLAHRIGGKNMLLGSIFFGSILTLLTPVFAKWSYIALRIIHIIVGFTQGATIPAIYAIGSKWAPPVDRCRFFMIATAGTYVGCSVAIAMASTVCENIGWQGIFYLYGGLGLIWCICCTFLISESPVTDKRISRAELTLLQDTLRTLIEKSREVIPWRSILTSVPFWALTLAHFTHNFAFYLVLFQTPMFLKDVHEFKIETLSKIAASPYWIASTILPISAYLADMLIKNEYLSVTHVRKLFTCGSFVLVTFATIGAACWLTTYGSIICTNLIITSSSFSWAGFSINHLDICPQFASITMGITNTFGSLTGEITSTMVVYFVHGTLTDPITGWRIVFFNTSWVCIFGFSIYAAYASGERQPWAADEASLALPRKTHKDFVLTKSFCC